MTEDEILTAVTVEAVLARLTPADRALMHLVYGIAPPEDYAGTWPPTHADIGFYIGMRFEGYRLSEAAVRYRKKVILAMLRGERGPMRRITFQKGKKSSQPHKKSRKTASKPSRKRRKG